MAQVTIKYDEKNSMAKKLIDFILSVDFFHVEKIQEDECPYDKEFMEKIRKNAKSSGKIIKTEDLWK